MKNKKAIFTRQPQELLDAIAADAKAFKLTKDGVVQAALVNHFLFKKEERTRLYSRIPRKIFGRPLAAALLLLCTVSAQAYTADQIANAIRIEEGSNPRWLYGIHHKGSQPLSDTIARQRCLATIRHHKDLATLAKVYCPYNSASWLRNVQSILKKHYGPQN